VTTVIVQADSTGAWIGLAGVALGALLSTGGTWLQRRWSEHREQRRSVKEAIDELPVAARTLLLTLQSYRGSDDAEQALLAWTPLMTAQMERVQRAAQTIMRYSTPGLASMAEAVTDAIIPPSPRVQGATLDETKFHDAIEAFTSEAREAKI
jgi:hypothetical protein